MSHASLYFIRWEGEYMRVGDGSVTGTVMLQIYPDSLADFSFAP